MSVAGQHVVITGGGSGVGAEMARVFAGEGAKVTILGRSYAPLKEVAEETSTRWSWRRGTSTRDGGPGGGKRFRCVCCWWLAAKCARGH